MKDKLYNELTKWINNTNNEELEEHYNWYDVEVGDKQDLINTMYESYLDSYGEAELIMLLNEGI